MMAVGDMDRTKLIAGAVMMALPDGEDDAINSLTALTSNIIYMLQDLEPRLVEADRNAPALIVLRTLRKLPIMQRYISSNVDLEFEMKFGPARGLANEMNQP
jgi:hypothetical protein